MDTGALRKIGETTDTGWEETLFIAPPIGHTISRLVGLFGRLGLVSAPAPRGILGVVLDADGSRRLAIDLSGALSRLELADGRCLLLGILSFYRRSGFRVALDDLGAGYSSLNLLARLRPDFVKLDMQLIRGIDEDPYKAVVVEKMLDLAREVGATSVVEGVETEGEWRWAESHGADLAQGFYCARPGPDPPIPFLNLTHPHLSGAP